MSQIIYLKQETEDPIYCLKTGDQILKSDNQGLQINQYLQGFIILGETVEYMVPDLQSKWDSYYDNDELEEPFNDFLNSLSDDYVIFHIDSSSGALLEHSTLIFKF
ncbi:hypothetical protein PP178_02790 [Zeaxanthinibacter sp. PT1]|uniref:hypothetical protein n=1 Tax=Zeaxanthinibacter TaxID=561554 RepID=UPI00234AEE1D|nr:hypothetical protein [Zeaxanthinibacter sp. PT1]MDC6350463.1 hypothetical protein [Zeaxanthinibacter sp. PT1]